MLNQPGQPEQMPPIKALRACSLAASEVPEVEAVDWSAGAEIWIGLISRVGYNPLDQSGQGSLPLHPAGLPVGQAFGPRQHWTQQAASALCGQLHP